MDNTLEFKEVCQKLNINFPAQHQDRQPGMEYLMDPLPIFDNTNYIGTNKLKDKVAVITGGDSGIGRAVAVLFAKEGADIAIIYYDEHYDAEFTKNYIESLGRKCLLVAGDIRNKQNCTKIIEKVINTYNHIDILINNAGVAYSTKNIEDITEEQLASTFYTNIISYFYMVQEALKYMPDSSVIINTASSTAYIGYDTLMDYSASKSAVVSFTRTLALYLSKRNIKVNAVAPGPTWTPIVPASASAQDVEIFGNTTLSGRAAEPFEIAPAYLYLASNDSSFVTGQVLHVDDGSTMAS